MLNVTFSDFIGLPKNETADSAQPRNSSTVSRPFSSSFSTGFEQEEEEEYDDDDTNFVKSRLAVFSRGELTVRMNLLGACIARHRPDSSYLGVLKA